MHEDNYQKLLKFYKGILHKIRPRFSFHYVAYSVLFFIIIFSVVNLVSATTPNPGHPWSEVGDGVFSVTDNQTATRTYTFPDANATVLTTNNLVTVAQGGTGLGTIADKTLLVTTGANTLGALTIGAGQSIRRNAGDTAFEAYTPSSGTGTVTSVSTAAANNGVTATWSMASPTPALTIGLGNITPSTVNGLTLSALTTGFTIAGGTTSKTLTVGLDASVSGTNTGDQTKIANLTGGNNTTLLGSLPYQSNTDTTTLLSPNVTSTKNFLTMTGTGSNGAIPVWGTITQADVSGLTTGSSPTFLGATLNGTLAMGTNSITGTGSLGATGARITKGWFTDLEMSNLPSVGGVALTTTVAKLNYLTSATGTTGTNTTNLVFSTSPALTTPTVVTSIVGDATFAAFNTVTTNLSLGGAATTLTIGGTPTGAVTHNYSTNATAASTTKTINFGTGGVASSTTNINIGSANGGTTTVNSPTLSLGTGSLTMSGSLAATGSRVTKGWFTDLEMSNLPSVGGVALTTTVAKLNYLTSATGTTGTNTTNLVFSTSPSLTTPSLGVATATSINGVALSTSARATDRNGVSSDSMSPIQIVNKEHQLNFIVSKLSSYVTLLMPLIALLVLIIILLLYAFYRIRKIHLYLNRKLSNTKNIVSKSFDILDEDAEEEAAIFRKIRTGKILNKDEQAYLEKFKEDINEAEKVIEKELKEI